MTTYMICLIFSLLNVVSESDDNILSMMTLIPNEDVSVVYYRIPMIMTDNEKTLYFTSVNRSTKYLNSKTIESIAQKSDDFVIFYKLSYKGKTPISEQRENIKTGKHIDMIKNIGIDYQQYYGFIARGMNARNCARNIIANTPMLINGKYMSLVLYTMNGGVTATDAMHYIIDDEYDIVAASNNCDYLKRIVRTIYGYEIGFDERFRRDRVDEIFDVKAIAYDYNYLLDITKAFEVSENRMQRGEEFNDGDIGDRAIYKISMDINDGENLKRIEYIVGNNEKSNKKYYDDMKGRYAAYGQRVAGKKSGLIVSGFAVEIVGKYKNIVKLTNIISFAGGSDK